MTVINRSDFGGRKDSEGREYFDYLLNSIGVDDAHHSEVDSIEIEVSSYSVFNEDGEKFYPGITNTELMELGGN